MRLTTVLLFAACMVPALNGQTDQPQLVWEGEVDGVSVLHVRGDRLDIEDLQGSPVGRERHRFFVPLPAISQDVQFRMLQARGAVRILRQPRPDNNFTFSVRIEDPIGGRSLYSLAFFWNTGVSRQQGWPTPVRPRRNAGRGEEQLTWTGRVDNEAIVECRANACRAAEQRGAPVIGERSTFTRPMPTRDFRVSLDNIDGRGEVQLIDQPGPGNNYTARIRIRDPQPGTDEYGFSLFWVPPRESEPDRLFAQPGMTWSGRVDGVVRLQIMGTSGATQLISGSPAEGDRYVFSRAMPFGAMPNLAVRKLKGRGRVEIVEFPSDRNGYRASVEINDSDAGSDSYEIEIGW